MLAILVLFISMMGACTEKKPDLPIVLELRALPVSISISDKYFYPKPFSIRAKYSNNTEKNITARVSWVSENVALLTVNGKGEIKKSGECLQKKCIVSLIATDPESGKSLRLTIKIAQSNLIVKRKKKSTDQSGTAQSKSAQIDQSTSRVLDRLKSNSEVKLDAVGAENPNLILPPKFKPPSQLSDNSPKKGSDNDRTFTDEFERNSSDFRSPAPVSFIDRLVFEKNEERVFSGNSIRPRVVALDNFGQQYSEFSLSYECFLFAEPNDSIIGLPDCQLIASEPGEAQIGLKVLTERPNIGEDSVITLRVESNKIASTPDGFSQAWRFAENSGQTWFNVSGLRGLDFYQVVLSGGPFSGYRVFVYTGINADYPACINTLPTNSRTVSCYFQTGLNDVTIVVENISLSAAQINLAVKSVDAALFQHSALINEALPVALALDSPVSAFIFANETEIASQHFYIYEADGLSKKGFIVRIARTRDFDELVQLYVTWPDGFCNEAMMERNIKEVICRVPSYVVGKIRIKIDGNNSELGLQNGSIAVNGGTFYKITIGKLK